MRVILDTDVFVSGVFFTGPPYRILQAWDEGRFQLVVSADILAEYHRVGKTLQNQFHGIDLDPILRGLLQRVLICQPRSLPEQVCDDPTDDMLLACALGGRCKIIISGDKHLLRVTGYRGIEVVRPRKFTDDYLQ
ncbi:putative toxin-antitoxin system toxin component, PIN family [Candidatus Eisenbacteria bacterium]|uniref:Toxin-antitoxin system toxin component, PIN family n=1 Tax=Eiseniibacteriota bacterium TaxID=2212470 RepID=A0ABV6YLA9_UNCEI